MEILWESASPIKLCNDFWRFEGECVGLGWAGPIGGRISLRLQIPMLAEVVLVAARRGLRWAGWVV